MNSMIFRILKYVSRLWLRCNRASNARWWSNDELRKIAPWFSGAVMNVSAGRDGDKEGHCYREYFSAASAYEISNFQFIDGLSDRYMQIELDLNVALGADSSLKNKYDVVFTHTVLEHIYDINQAITNLCEMTRDIVISIVPFMQPYHCESGLYQDYWRISPQALAYLFNERGLRTVYISWNNDPVGNIYTLHVASKHPERWAKLRAQQANLGPGHARAVLLSGNTLAANASINNLTNTTGIEGKVRKV